MILCERKQVTQQPKMQTHHLSDLAALFGSIEKKVRELMKVILICCRQAFVFLPNPNMAKLTARQNTTELLIMTADSVNLIIRKQK